MGWKTLDEIAKAGPMRTSLELRIEGDRVAHYLDTTTGRRMVWQGATSKTPPPRELSELRSTVAELRSLIGDLRSERLRPKASTPATRSRKIPQRRSAPPIRSRTVQHAPILKAPIPETPVRKAPAAISETEVSRIMEARAGCPLGDKALQRAAGLASNWFWKVKRGQCRSALATLGWSRLDTFLTSQTQTIRRAA